MPAAKKKVAVQDLTPEALMAAINKKYGAGTMKLGSDPSLEIERIPTGVLSVDYLLGGGVPRGRHVELFGSAGIGKTTLVYRTIAAVQAAGGRAAYIDVEKTFDPEFAAHLGVDLEALALHRQINANRVVDFVETLLRSEMYDVIGVDSIAALTPKIEIESDMETTGSMGMEQAKLMSKALRKLTTANERTVIMWINQTRDSVGGVFAKKNVTSGGRAMGFYAGIRIEMVRTETLKRKGKVVNPKNLAETDSDVAWGHRVLLRVEKDKTGSANPYDQTSFVFSYDQANIDHLEDLVYVGRVAGLIHKSGSDRSEKWWVDGYEDEKQSGRTRFRKWLRKNRAVAEELEERIWQAPEDEDEEDE